MPEKVAKKVRRILDRNPRLASRSLPVRMDASGRPSTLDEAGRSVEVTASTQAPVEVMDWETWRPIREVLLVSGCRIPPSGSVPLLDSHSRFTVSDIIGSYRDIRAEDTPSGPVLTGRAVFSATEDGEKPFRKVAEGHITDVSVGYEIAAHIRLRENETTEVNGVSYAGPMRIVTDWSLRELSLCPIGADPDAVVRAAHHKSAPAAGRKQESTMPKNTKAGGRKAAITEERKAGIVARLRALLGMRAEEEEKEKDEDERDDDALLVEAVGDLLDADARAEGDDEDEDKEHADDDKDKDERAKSGKASLRSRAAVYSALASLAARNGDGKRGYDDQALRAVLAALAPDGGDRAAVAERSRIKGIRAMAHNFNLSSDVEDKLVASGDGLESVKAKVLDMVAQRASNGPGFHVSVGETEQQKFGAAARDSLYLRVGARMLKHDPGSPEYRMESPRERALREPAPGARDLLSLPLPMLCRDMLRRSGQRIPTDTREIVGRALTTTDLPHLLVETSHRILLDAYDTAAETWVIWALRGQVADFKKTKLIGFEGDVSLMLKPENDEYTEGHLAEHAEEYAIQTFGRKMSISRESLINDDLNALSRLPGLYGQAAAALVGDITYEALLSAPPMGDGKALFHVGHRNLYAGKGGAPTIANLGAVVTGMKLQKDSFGKTISIQPKFFIAPVAMEVAAEQFFNTQLMGAGSIVGTGDAPFIHNPYGGAYFTRVYDRRLDDDAPDNWYLAAKDGTIVVFFLGGVEAPYIESQANFNTDGVESKVRMDVGAKAVRSVTLAKATAE
ncbi:MAG: hypothetical protein LBQ51_05720 [Desulfovibrio sp.]|jgi:hypothetical protein|nr:hypothetical protein [Desulfovibrio sp.]